MAGRDMRGDAGEHLLAVLGLVHGRPGLQLPHIELRHGGLAPRLVYGPGQLLRPHHDAGAPEQRPVDAVIVMRMGHQEVGHVRGLEPVVGEAMDQQLADPETAGIDQRDPALAADQDDRAPAEPAVAHRLARITLDQDVDLVAVDLHGLPCVLEGGRSVERSVRQPVTGFR